MDVVSYAESNKQLVLKDIRAWHERMGLIASRMGSSNLDFHLAQQQTFSVAFDVCIFQYLIVPNEAKGVTHNLLCLCARNAAFL